MAIPATTKLTNVGRLLGCLLGCLLAFSLAFLAAAVIATDAAHAAAPGAPAHEAASAPADPPTPHARGATAQYGPGVIVRSTAPCATHTLVSAKGGQPLYALRSRKVDLDRYLGRYAYLYAKPFKGHDGKARCGGLPVLKVRGVNTWLR